MRNRWFSMRQRSDGGRGDLLLRDGPHPNLSVLLRSDAAADSSSAHANAALRLPFPGNPRRAAGENLQAPRVSARARNGRRRARPELDDLLAPEEARCRADRESPMPARLRADRPDLQTRSAHTREGPEQS